MNSEQLGLTMIMVLNIVSFGKSLKLMNASLITIEEMENFHLIDEDFSPNDEYIFLGQCRNMGFTEVTPHYQCDIVLRRLPISESSKPIRKCNIQLTENSMLVDIPISKIRLQHLNEDVVILKWDDQTSGNIYTNLLVVSMTDCSTKSLQFFNDISSNVITSNILISKDSFEVLTADKELCFTKTCKIGYDREGNRKYIQYFPLSLNNVFITPMEDTQGNRNFFVLGFKDAGYDLDFISKSNDKINLATFQRPKFHHIPVSKTNQKYGLCFTFLSSDNRIKCIQYDASVDMKMDSLIEVERNYSLLGTYNLADNAMLVVISDCMKKSFQTFKCNNLLIAKLKIDDYKPNLSRFYSIALNEFTCNFDDGLTKVDIAENDEDICFYVICSHKIANDDENLAVHSSFLRSACTQKMLIPHFFE
ncbi:hypothetical protein QAD02_016544 [Eretmocerus hayati]|uniref:Uncharacterized protein n=1 Tax=Eretmocerus hayati TaxID=131215 RepID=A0ACC2PE75_9HYME|nr:hypothetical protein QAD02_016544 [Eretmocerus hayati]